VIVSDRDVATPPALGRLIHDRIPGARLVTLDAAHISNVEQPAAFEAAVMEFLDE
jgi:3-oxoadipate enol-lactonase